MTAMYVVIAVLVLVALWAVLAYNALVRSRNKVDEAWSGVDVQLKRRHDLVPNLVETVKGYAAHERATLEAVTEARGAAEAAGRPARGRARRGASSRPRWAPSTRSRRPTRTYARRRTSSASRPSWPGIEDEIQASRRIYNANVQAYNTRIQVFPTLLIAGPMSFRPASSSRSRWPPSARGPAGRAPDPHERRQRPGRPVPRQPPAAPRCTSRRWASAGTFAPRAHPSDADHGARAARGGCAREIRRRWPIAARPRCGYLQKRRGRHLVRAADQRELMSQDSDSDTSRPARRG